MGSTMFRMGNPIFRSFTGLVLSFGLLTGGCAGSDQNSVKDAPFIGYGLLSPGGASWTFTLDYRNDYFSAERTPGDMAETGDSESLHIEGDITIQGAGGRRLTVTKTSDSRLLSVGSRFSLWEIPGHLGWLTGYQPGAADELVGEFTGPRPFVQILGCEKQARNYQWLQVGYDFIDTAKNGWYGSLEIQTELDSDVQSLVELLLSQAGDDASDFGFSAEDFRQYSFNSVNIDGTDEGGHPDPVVAGCLLGNYIQLGVDAGVLDGSVSIQDEGAVRAGAAFFAENGTGLFSLGRSENLFLAFPAAGELSDFGYSTTPAQSWRERIGEATMNDTFFAGYLFDLTSAAFDGQPVLARATDHGSSGQRLEVYAREATDCSPGDLPLGGLEVSPVAATDSLTLEGNYFSLTGSGEAVDWNGVGTAGAGFYWPGQNKNRLGSPEDGLVFRLADNRLLVMSGDYCRE